MGNKSSYETLRRRSDFLSLSKNGRRAFPNAWMIVNYRKNEFGHLRCGWTIPKYVGNAVLRNRLKRWCREYFRNFAETKPGLSLDLNVVLRRREKDFYKNVSHGEFDESLRKALRQIQKRQK